MGLNFKKAASVAARLALPNRPRHAQWMITRKCNYKCIGCNVWREPSSHELSASEIKKGLDILKDLGVMEIVISGGNPLLRNDVDEILEYATQRFITTVYDNGSMAAEKIEALRNVDFVAISIDSLDPEKNDHIKGVKGSLQKALHAVNELHRQGVNVCVTPTISQLNLYEILDITRYFTQKNIPVWYCLYSYDVSADERQLFKIGKMNDELAIRDKHAMVKLCDALIEMKAKNNRILMTNELLIALRKLYSDGERTWECKALQSFLMVDHLGRIAGCHSHNFSGSVFDLPKLWRTREFDGLREAYRKCRQCTYLCYIFYSLHGSPRGYFSLAREQWKNAKLLLKKQSN